MDYAAVRAMAAVPQLTLPLRAGDTDMDQLEIAFSSFLPQFLSLITPNGTTSVDGLNGPGDLGAYYGDFDTVPASGKAIAALPKTTVGEESRQEECAVCLEAYETGQALRTMPCSHDFHESCISNWLRVSRVCPLCRFKLPPVWAEEANADEEEEEEDDDDSSTC